ncbi:ABC transporter ATP-binding protein [Phyllobacterium sp. SB3]|uniref:ABC transporter ATP-binding protein n=1 Tax=Phyllobacterium sp. SB3 TaxID=3156073 RepID=UPI0032AFC608
MVNIPLGLNRAHGSSSSTKPNAAGFLRVKDVCRQFDSIFATRNVSIDIAEGEFLVMLGPSGSGKTTLLRIIAGFETATSGAIEIRGRDVSRDPPNKRNIGVVFQNLALFPHLTVFKNVAFGLEMRSVPNDEIRVRVREALEMVRLGGMTERLPSQLSGGQQQRVALARALVTRPDILLLDEPLSALDRDLRSEMQYEIRRIQQQLGITAVMVTHDQDEAMTMGDRIAILCDGQLSQIGAAEDIYSHPNSAFVARFMGAANIFPVESTKMQNGETSARLASGFETTAIVSPATAEGSLAVLIRPEDIAIGDAAADMRNRAQARVVDQTYLGAFTRLVVDIDGGPNLAVLLPSRSRPARLGEMRLEDRIAVGWNSDAVLVVPA